MSWMKIGGLTVTLAVTMTMVACSPSPAPAPAPAPATIDAGTPLPTIVPSRTPGQSSPPVKLPTKTPRPTVEQVARKATPTPPAVPTATFTPTSAPAAASAPIKTRSSAPAGTPAGPAPTKPAQAKSSPKPTGHIAFAMGRGDETDIALLDVATGKITVVATNGRQPDIRGDGVIVFNGEGGGRDDLFTVMSDGRYLTEISSHAEDSYPQWSPSKPSIIYSSPSAGEDRIYVQADTSGPQSVNPQSIDVGGGPLPIQGRYPTWLANRRMAFTGCDVWQRAGSCGIWTGYTNQSDSFVPFQINDDPQAQSTDSFGDALLYSSKASGNWEVYAVWASLPSKRGNPKPVPVNLTNNPSQDVGATFSPDAKHIAFISDRGGSWGIWIMDEANLKGRLLAPVPGGFGPRWSEERLSWGN
jgi:hypothetical protein